MKKGLIVLLVALYSGAAAGQSHRMKQSVDLSFAAAHYQGVLALSFVNEWTVKQKLTLGLGLRYTGYLGANQYYATAPATLTSGSTSPLIIFKNNIDANIDTFLVKSPQVNALNLSINLAYRLNSRLDAGFNIDAIGFSFGASRTGNYINGPSGKMVRATPTPFNILLVSDNDKGTLNSEFFVRYALNGQWGLKLGASFLFTEYTTDIPVQQYPQANDRFRNKSLLAMIGITYKFHAYESPKKK